MKNIVTVSLMSAVLLSAFSFADVSAEKCSWLNRYYYESFCGIRVKKDGKETGYDTDNQTRQGVCAGEMVCTDSWSYETLKFNKGKFEKNAEKLEAGIYPVNCPAKQDGEHSIDQTCEKVDLKSCLDEHMKMVGLDLVSEKTTKTIGLKEPLNQQITGPKAIRKEGESDGRTRGNIVSPTHK